MLTRLLSVTGVRSAQLFRRNRQSSFLMFFQRSFNAGRAHVIATFVAALGLTACGSLTGERACTLIGCESGLTVHLATLPAAPFRVEVAPRAGVGQPVYVYECATSAACGPNLFFPGFIAEQVVVTVRVGAAARTTTISQVTYERFRPNGPDCPPECLQSTVTAEVPA